MPLHPQAKAFLDQVNATTKIPFHELGAVKAREVYADRPPQLAPEWVSVFHVEDKLLETAVGDILVRCYTPVESEELLPVLVFYHGGGMVIGTLDGYDTLCRQLAVQSGCLVVSVDYRLAPENKFPAAVEDAYHALAWIVEHAPQLGADPERIAIGGDSAGGNLTAVVALLARDHELADIKCQLLAYPATAAYADMPSHFRNAKGYFLERETILWFHSSYIRSDRDRQDFRYAPLIADSLANLPPAMVIVAGYDNLHDEGVAYAERMRASGVDVELLEYEGMFHPFLSMAGILDDGKDAITQLATYLKRYLLV